MRTQYLREFWRDSSRWEDYINPPQGLWEKFYDTPGRLSDYPIGYHVKSVLVLSLKKAHLCEK